ncbi:MAG: hypothetical protein IJF40_06600 [Clostridia bacterium]|nr:hypothetical protein [Clostridia bacterium]
MTIKEKLEKLKVPSPLDISGERVKAVAEWEKVRPLVEETMLKCEYGYMPEKPKKVTFDIKETDNRRCCAGKAVRIDLDIVSVIGGEKFSFPVTYIYPKKGDKFKTVVHINFRPNIPDEYMPTEEIIDNGFACASFCYKDVTSDDEDFTNGLAGVIYKDSERSLYSPGKIAMWAWAAMRVMDFLQTRDEVDEDNIAVAGHSRLGKTALLTAAMDDRFAVAHSNCAGCSGDSLNRGKTAGNETIEHIVERFPFWFCENYKNFKNKDNETPFDQHFLFSLIAPRKVHIASASQDIWAGPELEFLCCAASSEVYELYGKKGFVYEEDDFLKEGKYLNDGNVGLCYREGCHYFSRDDWHGLMDFMNR